MAVVSERLKGRHFTRVADWSGDELQSALDLADDLKDLQRRREEHHLLPGRALGMIFQKPSTRTRVSFAVGIAQLGGHGLYLAASDLQLGRGETLRDTATVLSRYLDGLMIRTFAQDDVEELARHATIPVINGLTDSSHPCQALADVMTIRERLGRLEGVRVAYLGDGNNVCASLMVAAAKLGMEFVAATPEGYGPDADVSARHGRADRRQFDRLALGVEDGREQGGHPLRLLPVHPRSRVPGVDRSGRSPAVVRGCVHRDVPARGLAPRRRQHALPLDLRQQRRGRDGEGALLPLVPGRRARGDRPADVRDAQVLGGARRQHPERRRLRGDRRCARRLPRAAAAGARADGVLLHPHLPAGNPCRPLLRGVFPLSALGRRLGDPPPAGGRRRGVLRARGRLRVRGADCVPGGSETSLAPELVSSGLLTDIALAAGALGLLVVLIYFLSSGD